MCRAYMLTVNVFRSELVFFLLLTMQDVNGLKQKISRVCIAQYFILVFCVVCCRALFVFFCPFHLAIVLHKMYMTFDYDFRMVSSSFSYGSLSISVRFIDQGNQITPRNPSIYLCRKYQKKFITKRCMEYISPHPSIKLKDYL